MLLPVRGLYAITDHLLHATTEDLAGAVESAIRGGAVLIQYRDKGTEHGARRKEAEILLEICRSHKIPLIINDDVELAGAIQADGVHVGKYDRSLTAARDYLGKKCIIGVSCYNSIERAEYAQKEGADYVAFGRFYSSKTKPEAVQVTVDQLREFRARIHLPIAAIGGITSENGASLVEAGADLLAVIHGVFSAPDVEIVARQYVGLF